MVTARTPTELIICLHVFQDQTKLVSEMLSKCVDDDARHIPFTEEDSDAVDSMTTRYLFEDEEYTLPKLKEKIYELEDKLSHLTDHGQEEEYEITQDRLAHCELAQADPFNFKVGEWRVVSNWLAKELVQRDEVVLQNEYGTWWGVRASETPLEEHTVLEEIAGVHAQAKRGICRSDSED